LRRATGWCFIAAASLPSCGETTRADLDIEERSAILGGWESGWVEANGVRLHYTRTGGEKPPLVLAHGVTDSGLCWSPLAEALAEDFDVIMVDARGHGKSDAGTSGFGPDVQAEDLAGLIAALGLGKPAVLGHSMGAATALVLAGTHPELPGAILLEDPPAWWTDWYETVEAGDRVVTMREAAIARKTMTREALIAEQRARQPGWSDAELEPWADAKQAVSLEVMSVFDRSNPKGVDWPATMRRISCPALLIVSDPALGGIVTPESATELRELVPQIDIAHIGNAGHNIRRDQFDRYLEVVRGFLTEHAARGEREQVAID
jgi:pimeloyl-ACP methyl ester carboxylesterase